MRRCGLGVFALVALARSNVFLICSYLATICTGRSARDAGEEVSL